jgi:hypothetical protein
MAVLNIKMFQKWDLVTNVNMFNTNRRITPLVKYTLLKYNTEKNAYFTA